MRSIINRTVSFYKGIVNTFNSLPIKVVSRLKSKDKIQRYLKQTQKVNFLYNSLKFFVKKQNNKYRVYESKTKLNVRQYPTAIKLAVRKRSSTILNENI